MGLAAITGRGTAPASLLLDRANTALEFAKHTARGTAIGWHPGMPVLEHRHHRADPAAEDTTRDKGNQA